MVLADDRVVRVKLGLFKNKKGVSIIQVLMAAGMTSIVSLGVVTMIENSRKMQRRTTLMSTLNELKTRLETNMRDQLAFNNIVNINTTAPWSQLKASTAVTEMSLSSPNQFIMYDAVGTAINLLGTAASDTAGPYNGFTERGGSCGTFSPILGQGSENCPISYRLLVVADCPKVGDTSCRDPHLIMVARLVFNPSNSVSSTMNNWRGLFPTVSGSSLVSASEKYDAEVRRTAATINKSFYISASVTATGAPDCFSASATTTGGGTCQTGSAVIHPITQSSANSTGWVEESDPHSLVTVTPGTGVINFTQTGLYRCVAVAKVFSTNVTISLYNSTSGTTTGSGAAIAGNLTEAEARMDVTVNVTSPSHNYIIRQQCDSTALKSCTLGFAKTGYSAESTRLLRMTCDRMDVQY